MSILFTNVTAVTMDPAQPLLNNAVNDRLCRCAGFDGQDTALTFLRRCFLEERTIP